VLLNKCNAEVHYLIETVEITSSIQFTPELMA